MLYSRLRPSAKSRCHGHLRQGGFTLVEAIIVIVITGVMAAVIAVFIRIPVQGYIDTAARAELTDVADTALRRMARDLRLALPNSIRVTTDASGNQYLELLLTKSGGRYLAEEDNQGSAGVLSFRDATAHSFTVVGNMPSPAITAGTDSIVVYNMRTVPTAYDCSGMCNRALVTAVVGNTVTLATNPFAAQNPAMQSPTKRFQVVSTPVTYVCPNPAATTGGGSLTRYWGYAIQSAQPASLTAAPLNTASSAVLANRLTSCSFDYASLANIHSGLVGLHLTLEIPSSNSGAITLFHQVHVDNTP